MNNFYDVTSDDICCFVILVDESGSMRRDAANVVKGLKNFKSSFDDFELSNSVIVCVCFFNSNLRVGSFRPVKEMSIPNYDPDGGTALSYAIVNVKEYLDKYIQEFVRRNNMMLRTSFICMSDGRPEGVDFPISQAMEAIQQMNISGIDTAFAALGTKVDSSFGKKLGFKATIDVTDREKLLQFLGVELSNSCKEQSKSRKPLGASFFSQAAEKSQSQEYSQRTSQVLEDYSWVDDI